MIVSIAPNCIEGYIARGEAYFLSGEIQKSVEDCERALSINPNCPEAYNVRGIARFSLGNHQGAKEDFLKAFDLFHTQNNMVACVFTRSLIFNHFQDYEAIKDLIGRESA
ncbi:tetratricopeptide repeat protein [Mastigocladus laminosus UU774]|nr:tetratricopeptide repeat protein [Mastigocladus laminosus UU774]